MKCVNCLQHFDPFTAKFEWRMSKNVVICPNCGERMDVSKTPSSRITPRKK